MDSQLYNYQNTNHHPETERSHTYFQIALVSKRNRKIHRGIYKSIKKPNNILIWPLRVSSSTSSDFPLSLDARVRNGIERIIQDQLQFRLRGGTRARRETNKNTPHLYHMPNKKGRDKNPDVCTKRETLETPDPYAWHNSEAKERIR